MDFAWRSPEYPRVHGQSSTAHLVQGRQATYGAPDAAVVRAAPRIVLKYLGGYLGTDLSESERASILINHYTFLKDRVEQGFFRKIVDGRLELWKHAVSNGHVRICVAFPVRIMTKAICR